MNRIIALLFLGMILALSTVPVSAFFDISVDAPVGTRASRRLLSKGQGHAYGDAPHGPNECHGSDCRQDDEDHGKDDEDHGKDDDDKKGKGKDDDDKKGKGKEEDDKKGKGKEEDDKKRGKRDRRRRRRLI